MARPSRIEFELFLLSNYITIMRWPTSFLYIAFAAFALYFLTAAPTILTFFDDSLEFQLVLPTLGIAHPTGYPLYTLLGAIWSRILFPFGNWAWRVNLFSSLAAGLTVGMLFGLAYQLMPSMLPAVEALGGQVRRGRETRRTVAALVAAFCFAIVPVWWQQATVAEVYALHGFFVVAILCITIRIRVASYSRTTSVNRAIMLLCLLIGLSLAHHRTTVLLFPGIGLYLLMVRPSVFRPQRAWLSWLIALTAPLLLYLYIPIRSAMGATDLNGSYLNSAAGFVAHVNASAYTTFFGWNESAWPIFHQQFSWWGIVWGVWGCFSLLILLPVQRWRSGPSAKAGFLQYLLGWRTSDAPSLWAEGETHWPEWLLVWVTFICSFLFGLYYQVDDVQVFLIPAYLCWTLFMGAGFWSFAHWVDGDVSTAASATTSTKTSAKAGSDSLPSLGSQRPLASKTQGSPTLLILCYGIVPLFIGVSPLLYNSVVNRSQAWQAHDQAIALAKVPYPPGSRLIGLEGEATALKYMQQAEGLAHSVTALWANDPEARLALVRASANSGSPLYLTREVAGIESDYSFTADGPVVRVWPRGTIEPREPQQRLDLSFLNGALLLDGVDVTVLDEAGGSRLQVTYYWRPITKLSQRIKLSLRLQDGEMEISDANGVEMITDRFPLSQVTYSEMWVPGEQLWDVQTIALPPSQEDAWFGSFVQLGFLGGSADVHGQADFENLMLNTIIYDAQTIEEIGRVALPIQTWLD